MKDLMNCNVCGLDFNMADLSEVVKHEHKGLTTNITKSKKVIRHASDVYKYCSGEFAGGVHSYLSGDEFPKYPSSNEFKEGYICAGRDLKDNYILNF